MYLVFGDAGNNYFWLGSTAELVFLVVVFIAMSLGLLMLAHGGRPFKATCPR